MQLFESDPREHIAFSWLDDFRSNTSASCFPSCYRTSHTTCDVELGSWRG
jgi:hypothetical protein